MAFNMLDGDYIAEQDGYTPSFTGSRTGSMKKFVKKQQRPNTALQKPAPLPTNDINDEFDNLLDQLMESKPKSKSNSNFQNDNKKKNVLDDLKLSDDSAFGQKQSITYNIEKTLPKPIDISNSNRMFNSKDTFKLSDDFNFSSMDRKNDEDASPLMRSRRESAMRKVSPKNVIEEEAPLTIGSSRMMRPPMNRKPSVNNFGDEKEPLMLSDEGQRLAQTAEPGRRRGSVLLEQKEDSHKELKLIEDEPYRSRQSSSKFPEPVYQQRIVQKPVERIVERIIEKVVEPKVDMSKITQEHQKQLSQLRQSYEKQLKTAAQAHQTKLNQQMQSKDKIINDLKQLLSKQKESHQKELKEETQKHQKMNDWQKQKSQFTLKAQIERLKQALQFQSKNVQESSVAYLEKKRIEDLEHKLKYQLESIESEKKKLSKIEQNLERREVEFQKFKTGEENKLKQQFDKISNKALKDIKKVSQDRNQILKEKQRMAIEGAEQEMNIMRMREQLLEKQESLKNKQQNFELMKRDSEMLNQQLYNNYKGKLLEVEQSKQNALLTENQLLNKLKIVELKEKRQYKGDSQFLIRDNSTTKYAPTRAQSASKTTNDFSKRLKNVQGYMKTQGMAQNRTFLSDNNTSFTLDKFIRNVDSYKKDRKQGIY